MPEERVSLREQQKEAQVAPEVVPTDAVPLPSKGVIYPPESPLHGTDLVEIKSMTAHDEDILTSTALLKQGKAISTLLRSCLINKAIDPDQMLVGDRNAVLIAIRVTGYGASYESDVECPRCGERSHNTFDLSKLPIKPLGASPIEEGKNEFEFELPKSRRKVRFRLMTGADDRELSTILERTRKVQGPGGVDPGVTTRLIMQITSIAGESDPRKLSALVRSMPALESRALRRHMDEINPDVEMKQTYKCSACTEESEVEVPLGTEFFWPSS